MLRRTRIVLLGLALAASCNGQGWTDPGPDAGIDRSHTVAGSSFDDRIRLCDWIAGRMGGYNRSRTCGEITFTSTPAQSQCIAGLGDTPSTCTLTFGELEDCVNALINGPCAADFIPDACYAVAACPAFGQETGQ
jgi:hypothetical protein